MVETLCQLYGEPVTVSSLYSSKTFHDFADPKRMADEPALEEVLRARGFGYRAPNIALAAKMLVKFWNFQLWIITLESVSVIIEKSGILYLGCIFSVVFACLLN